MGDAMEKITTIAIAIVGVATLAVLMSKKANTSAVIGASGNAFSTALATALSPITGANPTGGGLGGNGFVSPF